MGKCRNYEIMKHGHYEIMPGIVWNGIEDAEIGWNRKELTKQ